jgi:steroid 5-alpha reductase family enzyme
MMALPLHSVLVTPQSEISRSSWISGLSGSDILLATLTLITLYIQWCSDNQQYTYQNYKRTYLASQKDHTATPSHASWHSEISYFHMTFSPADAQRGYITRGLWSWSRHPNFACEQTFWLLQGLFAVLGTSPGLGTRRMLVLSHPLWGALAVRFPGFGRLDFPR